VAAPLHALGANDRDSSHRDVRAHWVALPDGRAIGVRPIRSSDEQLLGDAFARLSPESRYRRFLSPIRELPPGTLHHLTDVDHHDHEAFVAIAPGSGAIVGVARFIRSAGNPEAAELSVTVDDSWQCAGVGTVLVALLIDRARAEGVLRFVGEMLWANTPVHELLRVLGAPDFHGSLGVDEFSLPLPTLSAADRIPELLEGVAPGNVARADRRRQPVPRPLPSLKRRCPETRHCGDLASP